MSLASNTPHPVVPVLFLDIDGTVRHGPDQLGRFVNGPQDVVMFPEAVDRMREWKAAGGRIVGVSNQGGIALGHVTGAQVEAAMDRTVTLASHDGESLFEFISYCPHYPAVDTPNCWCRKPRPGLIYRSIHYLEQCFGNTEIYPPEKSLMVGDRPEDRECAKVAGIPFLSAEEWRTHGSSIIGMETR